MTRVRGSQESVPYLEVGKTEVRIRTNVERIEEDDFVGWEYDEEIVKIPAYVAALASQEETETSAFLIATLMQEIDDLKARVVALEGLP
jgi:hypothetical protein